MTMMKMRILILSESLNRAVLDYDEARRGLLKAGYEAIKSELTEIFKDPEVQTVRWGQKTSPYNDEGMYDGLTGPVLNPEVEETRWGTSHDWLYDYGVVVDSRLKALADVLNQLSVELLCEIIGDDEYVVTAERSDDPRGFDLTADHYGGY